MHTVTAQQYNRSPSLVKAQADDGPVFITDHGVVSHVILTIDDYERIRPPKPSILEALRIEDEELSDVEIPEFPRAIEPFENPFADL